MNVAPLGQSGDKPKAEEVIKKLSDKIQTMSESKETTDDYNRRAVEGALESDENQGRKRGIVVNVHFLKNKDQLIF